MLRDTDPNGFGGSAEQNMDYGIIVDLETTGLNPETDQIIEIGILEFAWASEDSLPIVASVYSELSDPGCALTPEVAKITGLNDVILAGKAINWSQVKAYFDRASIVIAHNMPFDRAFLLRRPELQPLAVHWACTAKHINWSAHGKNSRALTYLAADHGFLNPFPHRAIFDCATTFKIMAPYLRELIVRSYEREFKIVAVNSPFESKDKLRSRGYRWDAQARVWSRNVLECELSEERQFLQKEVYQDSGRQHEEIAVLEYV